MAQNIVVGLFEVESEAFQAMTELKQNPGTEDSYLTAAALIKKENGTLVTTDSFDTGLHTTDDMAAGGLVGALVGVLGGPIGVLLGGSYGALVGSVLDAGDAVYGVSLLEQTAVTMQTTIIRFDAAAVAAEVEEAQKMAEEMARQARKELRDEKKAARKEKREEKKAKLSAEWEGFKAKFKKA